jgi:lipoprotein signal peptidase
VVALNNGIRVFFLPVPDHRLQRLLLLRGPVIEWFIWMIFFHTADVADMEAMAVETGYAVGNGGIRSQRNYFAVRFDDLMVTRAFPTMNLLPICLNTGNGLFLRGTSAVHHDVVYLSHFAEKLRGESQGRSPDSFTITLKPKNY